MESLSKKVSFVSYFLMVLEVLNEKHITLVLASFSGHFLGSQMSSHGLYIQMIPTKNVDLLNHAIKWRILISLFLTPKNKCSKRLEKCCSDMAKLEGEVSLPWHTYVSFSKIGELSKSSVARFWPSISRKRIENSLDEKKELNWPLTTRA